MWSVIIQCRCKTCTSVILKHKKSPPPPDLLAFTHVLDSKALVTWNKAGNYSGSAYLV